MKICVVSCPGGHLTEVRFLRKVYEKRAHFYILNDKITVATDMQGKTYFVSHSQRDIKFLWNLVEAFRILWRERPNVILSTGAGPAVPVALVGKLLFGCKIIFVETITRVKYPSLTGKIMYRIADTFYYQHEALAPYFPKGRFEGRLF